MPSKEKTRAAHESLSFDSACGMIGNKGEKNATEKHSPKITKFKRVTEAKAGLVVMSATRAWNAVS